MLAEAATVLAVAFAGQPVQVACLPDVAVREQATSLGFPGAYGFALVGSGAVTMNETACRRLARMVARPRESTFRRDDWLAFDVMAVGHEVAHALGNPDEVGATCWSLGRMARSLHEVGVRWDRARRMRDWMASMFGGECVRGR